MQSGYQRLFCFILFCFGFPLRCTSNCLHIRYHVVDIVFASLLWVIASAQLISQRFKASSVQFFPQVSAHNSAGKADCIEISRAVCPCDPLQFFPVCLCREWTTCPYKVAVMCVNGESRTYGSGQSYVHNPRR